MIFVTDAVTFRNVLYYCKFKTITLMYRVINAITFNFNDFNADIKGKNLN